YAGEIGACAVRGAVPERYIAGTVGRDAAHPAVQRGVGSIDLLLHGRSGDRRARDIDLRPLRAHRLTGVLDIVDDPQRLGAADFTILHLLHETGVYRIELVGRVGLRNDN